jgi:hypothetical protein
MRLGRILCFLAGGAFLCYAPIRAAAQNGQPGEASGGVPEPAVFSLMPLLEAALSGDLIWRPDWPPDIPPDSFSLPGEQRDAPLSITLSNGDETYRFRRDSAGRLREFPFFSPDARMDVQAVYDSAAELVSMSVSAAAPGGNGEAGQTVWNITFPPDFLLYGGPSPVRVSRDGGDFFVFFLETPAFISETWYDEAGNLLAYFRAAVLRQNGSWRIRSLQTRDAEGRRSGEYAFDAGGNISEVRSPRGVFQALYRDKRPRYWERRPSEGGGDARFTLQWDERALLMNLGIDPSARADASALADEAILAEGEGNALADASALAAEATSPVEYRYEYALDAAGNWIRRQDIAIISSFGVFVPRPDRAWTRHIGFTGD